jgi:hypothetical protein
MEIEKEKIKPVIIKPHHFLDIIKLYGAGYEKFVPDEEHGHDFWRVGNQILEDASVLLELTLDNDAICAPCRSNNGQECVDMTTVEIGKMSKDRLNRMIDKRLLEKLRLPLGSKIYAIEFCRLAKKMLSSDDIAVVWKEKPEVETRKRIELLFLGLDK